MATPRRRISDHCIGHAGDNNAGRKLSLLRSGSDPRSLGISAASYLDHCNDQGAKRYQNETEDLAILSDLIAGPAGELAPALSRELIEICGSLVAVLAAAKIRELPTSLISDQVRHRLQYFAETMGSAWRQEALAAPIFSTSQALAKYLQFEMAALTRETFRVLFLDSANRLIRDQTMWEGSINRVQIHPREVVSLALETHSTALILIHNHPSGSAAPSAEDIRLTQKIMDACKLLDIAVHDHLIVARQDIFSMRSKQILAFTT